MLRVFIESVARDPDYLRMEMLSVLEGASAAKQFFENRWRSFTDYIEVSLKELGTEGRVSPVNPKTASLMFQGMIREALYEKCIVKSERYRETDLDALVQQLIDLFLRAIAYQSDKR